MQKVAKNAGADPATIHFEIAAGSNVALGDMANTPNRPIPRAIRVITTGNLHILDDANTWITYSVTAGENFPFRATRIGANTTANVVCWG